MKRRQAIAFGCFVVTVLLTIILVWTILSETFIAVTPVYIIGSCVTALYVWWGPDEGWDDINLFLFLIIAFMLLWPFFTIVITLMSVGVEIYRFTKEPFTNLFDQLNNWLEQPVKKESTND